MKKLILITTFAIIGLLAANVNAQTVIDSGYCGDDGQGYGKETYITWKFTSDSILIITGTGNMWDNWSLPKQTKTLIINEGVMSIGASMFYNFSVLTSVTLPQSLLSIGEYAFYACKSLTSIEIPNSVNTIGRNAFEDCSALISVNIPDSATSIGWWAFDGCSALTSVTIPNKITSIGQGAFSDCLALASVNIPDSLTSIEESVFWNCVSLTSVTIPNSVTSIKLWAFSGCSGITSLTIPSSVTSIENAAFSGCTTLDSVYVSWETPIAIDGTVFDPRLVDVSKINLIVPCNLLPVYSAANVWKSFSIIDSCAISVASESIPSEPLPREPLTGNTAMSVYPNPASGIVHIDGVAVDAEVSVYTLSGRLVERAFGNMVDLSKLPAGAYLLRAGNKAAKVLKR
jgi:hypothetical protein